ncbi:MAG TPA: hypothetical protein VGK73_18015 [Polyangiaceae bacterium]
MSFSGASMLRRPLALSPWLACFCLAALTAGSARAAASEAPDPIAALDPEAGAGPLRGFDLLASGAYGASTGNVGNLRVEPYSGTFGLELGYTFRSGFRVGAYFAYGLGRSVEQHRDARLWGDDFDFSVDASSVNAGVTLGYDLPLHFLVLRYSLLFGTTRMSWDLHGLPPDSLVADADASSPASGFLLAPGLTLFLPQGKFRCGVGFDYLVQANDAIPPGFLGKLLVGVKL